MSKLDAPFLIDVALLPSAMKPEQLSGHTVVVVDVLRATSTIVSALHHGCQKVLPQPSIELAREVHASIPEESVMGGERQGKIVDGFQHGNSPPEYTAEAIAGKTLVLATTNGTVAMESCRAADRVLIGAMVNVSAVAQELREVERVTVVCSGTDRLITSEDVLFAGLLIQKLLAIRVRAGEVQLTDSASIALHHWQVRQQEVESGQPLADFFRQCRGGKNLVRIGHDADVVYASQIDLLDHVPELDLDKWSIQ